jgi:DNA-binding MarR family transcriptional regulator
MSAKTVHTTLERLCNLLRVEARAHGASYSLLPIQLEVLHYLSQCNRYSDTPQSVTEFLGQTKGTVSQSLKVLEDRGLVRKLPDVNDRRLVHLKVTPAGRRVISKAVPARIVQKALELLPRHDSERLGQQLGGLLRAAQRANRGKSFAACHTCRFNERVDDGFRCGLTGEALSQAEVQLICREHEYPT